MHRETRRSRKAIRRGAIGVILCERISYFTLMTASPFTGRSRVNLPLIK